MQRFSFVLPLLLLSPAFAQAAQDAWIQDFAKAKAQAKAEKKDLLIDFTGSDWCSWCIKLDEEVFTQDVFKDAAPKTFVLVKLDFPQDPSRITPEIKAQNDKLGQVYNIQGYPTVLLTNAEGVVYGQTGYQKGGPEKYVAMLADLKKKGDVFQAAMLRAEAKQGAERAVALDEALASIDAEVVSAHHLATMEEIVKLDADGKAKLKDKYESRVKEIAEARALDAEMQQIQEVLVPMLQSGETDKAIAKLDEILKAPKNTQQHQVALFFKGRIVMGSGDLKATISLLEQARDLAPKSQLGEQIDKVMPQLKKQLEMKEKGADGDGKQAGGGK